MTTVLDRVLEHAHLHPERLCVRSISRSEGEACRTFGEVAAAAARAAAGLARRGVRAQDVVVMIGTHHPDFYAVWLGAMWLGAVPSVLAEPSVRIDKEIYWSRLRVLLERVDARLLATAPRVEASAGTARATYDELAASEGSAPPRAPAIDSDVALLQHSSGTTGLQKGVMLTHGAVMRHAASYLPSVGFGEDDVVASWLPLYHDMGLIACFVCPLIAGVPVLWLSPFEWVASPTLLLDAITRYRATIVWLPNFAYSFLAQRARPGAARWDLSSLRLVINCSEPVTAEAMDSFADRFARDGLRPEALHTCYAMAENVFAVTASSQDVGPRRATIDATVWRDEHRAVPPRTPDARGVVHVSSGVCVDRCEVRIAGDDGTLRSEGHAGRILIRSPFLLSGYFRRDDLNQNLLDRDGFYDTGDIGWMDREGHLYITGRLKDLVIVGGRNIYPQDVEQIAHEIDGIHPGRAVCFGAAVRGLGTEGLVILAESDLPEDAWPDVAGRLRSAIPGRLDLDVADVRIVAPGTLRKSTSGKLARDGNRQWYLEGRFGALPRHVLASEPAE